MSISRKGENTIKEYVELFWSVIKDNPTTFIIIFIISGSVVFGITTWHYERIIQTFKERDETQKTRLLAKDDLLNEYKQKLQKGPEDTDRLMKGLTDKIEDVLKKSGHDVTQEVRTKIQRLLVSTQIDPIVSRMGTKELETLRDFAMSRASHIRLDYLQNNPALQFLLSEGLIYCGPPRPLKDTPSLSEVTCVISESGKRIAWILLDVAKISLTTP